MAIMRLVANCDFNHTFEHGNATTDRYLYASNCYVHKSTRLCKRLFFNMSLHRMTDCVMVAKYQVPLRCKHRSGQASLTTC